MDPTQALTELPWTEMKISIAIIVVVALVALALIPVAMIVFVKLLSHQKDMIGQFLDRADKHVDAFVEEGKANRRHCREEMIELRDTHKETMDSLTASTMRLSEAVQLIDGKVTEIHRQVVRPPTQNVFKGDGE